MKHRTIHRKLGIAVTAVLLASVAVSGIQPASAQEGAEVSVIEGTAPEIPVEQEVPAAQETAEVLTVPENPAAEETEVPAEPEAVPEVPSGPESPAVPEAENSGKAPSEEETSEEEIPSEPVTPEEDLPAGDSEENQSTGQTETPGSEEEESSESSLQPSEDLPVDEPTENETLSEETSEEPAADKAEPEVEPSEEAVSAPALIQETPVLTRTPSAGEKRWEVSGPEKPSFLPSEQLLPKALRIKYNAEQPLEGIPSFITSEMITGALKVQDEYGYPASVTIAQIIQESGFGAYGPGGEEGQGLSYLAYQYSNLFGIKGTGTAGSVSMKTGEQRADGTSYTIRAGFRAYHTYSESMEDRAKLLAEVYTDLISGVTDANTFAMRIAGRWATDVDYGYSLIAQMERYDLYRLDRMTLESYDSLLGDFADPCPGASVTSRFGWRAWSSSFHKGIDLGTGAEEIPTYAAAAGTVTYAGSAGSAGNLIVIDHGDGVVTKYMHHSELYVEEGEQVEKGQQIGLSGSTGDSTGNHLHFQLEIGEEAVDPAPYLFADQQ